MFYLDRRGGDAATASAAAAARYIPWSNEEENFGWWLSDQIAESPEIAVSPRSHRDEDHRSSGSYRMSMLSRVDSNDSNNYSFARDLSRQETETGICEEIELSIFARDDLNIDLIERNDREKTNSSSTTVSEYNERETKPEAICYTPERLIRSQEYQILTPPPRRFVFSQARFTPERESPRKPSRCRKRLSRLIDSEEIGTAQLTTNVRTVPISERCISDGFAASMRSNEDSLSDQDRPMRSRETIDSSRLSYDRLNSTWDDCKGPAIRRYSLEDTSGIQSYDWSSDTRSDTRNTPMCLCDELAIASRDYTASFANDRSININEVTSILEGLQDDPEKATVLLEDDRFCECMSSHDQLTRLALAIETDAEIPATLDDSDKWVHRLRDKIERLQLANKEIQRDVCRLRKNFQCDEKKVNDLSSDTRKLRQDIHEMRSLDDLLKLLQGELERISKKNWPFLVEHSKPNGEINLIV